MTEAEIDAFLTEQRGKWEAEIKGKAKPVLDFVASQELALFADQLGTELTTISTSHPDVVKFLADQGGTAAKGLSDTMQKALRDTLLQGTAAGENVTDLQGRVRAVMNVVSSKALTIARTETGTAAVGVKYRAYELEGIKQHSWLTAGDGDTSDGGEDGKNRDHLSLDGEVVDIGTPFPNGLLHPLDPNGGAKECANCRCESLPEVGE